MNEKRIKQCRYYKGEEKCPYDNADMRWYWDMERVYVSSENFVGERDYYERIKGKKYSGIPYELLIIMFTSWAKYAYNISNEIDDFYRRVDDYLFIASDFLPTDKIP